MDGCLSCFSERRRGIFLRHSLYRRRVYLDVRKMNSKATVMENKQIEDLEED